MHQLVYESHACESLSPSDLFRIVEQSARNNLSADITGFLVYRGGQFLQLVEGPLNALDALLARLQRDPRHHSLRVLSRCAIAERAFPRWRMKRIGEQGDVVAELEEAMRTERNGAALPDEVSEFLQATTRV